MIEVTYLCNRLYQTEVRTFGMAVRKGYCLTTARALAKLASRTRGVTETTEQVIERVVLPKEALVFNPRIQQPHSLVI